MLLAQKLSPRLLSGSIVNDTYWRILVRFMVACLVSLPWVLLIPKVISYTGTKNAYTLLVFQTMIPCLFGSAGFFFFADVVNTRCGFLEMAKEVKGEENPIEMGKRASENEDEVLEGDDEESSMLQRTKDGSGGGDDGDRGANQV